ncbi:MAG: hypothetical protein PHG63_03220 [Candidatus Dojkabacteria bacterium]|nr:hypothetical protein [Candidatus Dojkabacteria bacterium]
MEPKNRTEAWLADRMYEIWENYFADVPRKNFVLIKFGRSASRQLGSIGWARKNSRIKAFLKKDSIKKTVRSQDDSRITVITITRKFKDPSIPDYVVDATIAHEIAHYVHGFSSPLKRQYHHPHKGGVVRKELTRRGLGDTEKAARGWIRQNWRSYA